MKRSQHAAKRPLLCGAVVTTAASLLHVAIIAGGPDWYRWFGAGEDMEQRDARGGVYPDIITACIATILGIWALYAFSGAGVISRLPALRATLFSIGIIYLARAILGVPAVVLLDHPYAMELRGRMTFMVVSSAICGVAGLCYAIGAANLPASRLEAVRDRAARRAKE